MGKEKARSKGNLAPADSSRLGEMVAFGGGQRLAFGASAFQVAGASMDENSNLSADAKIIFKRLSKRDTTTKQKATDDLIAHLSTASEEDISNIIPIWPFYFKKLYLEPERRLRENAFQCHRQIVLKAKKMLAPHLKDLIACWIFAQFDPAKEVSRLALETFEEAFPKKKEDALAFCQGSILSFVSEVLISGNQDTLADPRFFSPEELAMIYDRVASAAIRTFAFLQITLPENVTSKAQKDYDDILTASEFWSKTKSEHDEVRRAMYTFLKNVLTAKKYPLLQQSESLIRSNFLAQCFAEKKQANYFDLWDAVLLLSDAAPSLWNAKDQSLMSPFLTFLKNACWGTGKLSYPALLPFLSKLPKEVAIKEKKNILPAIWRPITKDLADGETSIAIVSAYLELQIFFYFKELGGAEMSDEDKSSFLDSYFIPFEALLSPGGSISSLLKALESQLCDSLLSFALKLPEGFFADFVSRFSAALDKNLFSTSAKPIHRELCQSRFVALISKYNDSFAEKAPVLDAQMQIMIAKVYEKSMASVIDPSSELRQGLSSLLKSLDFAVTWRGTNAELISSLTDFFAKYFGESFNMDDPCLSNTLSLYFKFIENSVDSASRRQYILNVFSKLDGSLKLTTLVLTILKRSDVKGMSAIESVERRLVNLYPEFFTDAAVDETVVEFIIAALTLPSDIGIVSSDSKDKFLKAMLPNFVKFSNELISRAVSIEAPTLADKVSKISKVVGAAYDNVGLDLQSFFGDYSLCVFRLYSFFSHSTEELQQTLSEAWKDIHKLLGAKVCVSLLISWMLDPATSILKDLSLHLLYGELNDLMVTDVEAQREFLSKYPRLHSLRAPYKRESSSAVVLNEWCAPWEGPKFDEKVVPERDVDGVCYYEKISLVLFYVCSSLGPDAFALRIEETLSVDVLVEMCYYADICEDEAYLGNSLLGKVSKGDVETGVGEILDNVFKSLLKSSDVEAIDFRKLFSDDFKGNSIVSSALRLAVEEAKSGEWSQNKLVAFLLRRVFSDSLASEDQVEQLLEISKAAPEKGLRLLRVAILVALNDISPTTAIVQPEIDRLFVTIEKWTREVLKANLEGAITDLWSLTVLLKAYAKIKTRDIDALILESPSAALALRKLRGLVDTDSEVPAIFIRYVLQILSSMMKAEWPFDLNLSRFISTFIEKTIKATRLNSRSDIFVQYYSLEFVLEAEEFDLWESFSQNIDQIRLVCAGHAVNASSSIANEVGVVTLDKVLGMMYNIAKEEASVWRKQNITEDQISNLFTMGSISASRIAYEVAKPVIQSNIESLILLLERNESAETDMTETILSADESSLLKKCVSLAGELSHLSNLDLNERRAVPYLLLWLVVIGHFEIMTFDLKRLMMSYLRDNESQFERAIELILKSLNVGTSYRPVDLGLWDVSMIEIGSFDFSAPTSLTLLSAHVLFKILKVLPSVAKNFWSNCKSRQVALAMESYVERYFSPAVVSSEVERVQATGIEDVEVKVSRTTGEVSGVFTVEDAKVDIVLRFPASYPLRQVEVESKSGGRIIGIQEGRWRSWLLSASIMAQNSSTLDALLLFQRNISGHFEGKEDCAICYSVVGVIDRTLPTKNCKTCKNPFHASCLYKVCFMQSK
ncbi:listerin E3 ubiquitin protein ligase 1 [Phlyctochytrium planicorne]|nr:listerin E3 ubiquitin protein ligase 1 [Phlyctochytrium planicorne]